MKGLRLKINIIEKKKKINNNIIIDNKKILLRINSISSNFINYKTFKYEKEDEIDFSNLKQNINNELDNFDYIFIIRLEEFYNEEFPPAGRGVEFAGCRPAEW